MLSHLSYAETRPSIQDPRFPSEALRSSSLFSAVLAKSLLVQEEGME